MKKWMLAAMAAMMVAAQMTTAMAAMTSKTTGDLVTESKTMAQTADGQLVETNAVIEVVKEVSQATNAYVESLVKQTLNEGKKPVECFPEETKQEIAAAVEAIVAAMPEAEKHEVSVENLNIHDVIPVKMENIEAGCGKITKTVKTATNYKAGQVVVVVVAMATGEVDENGNPIMEYMTVEAEVGEENELSIVFTEEQALRAHQAQNAGAELNFTVFSEDMDALM